MSRLIDALPKMWCGGELPGYRDHTDQFATYSLLQSSLPPINVNLDDDLSWLPSRTQSEDDYYLNYNFDEAKQRLELLLKKSPLKLPGSFERFFSRPEHSACIRSCTACYLLLPHNLIKTTGLEDGVLLQFLSDQQGCCYWSLYQNTCGEHCVICSLKAYAFPNAQDSVPTMIDLSAEKDIWVCSSSFSEFLYRFWIENEIWFSLAQDDVPLTPTQLEYVDFYGDHESSE
jgi:hypothetical protein